MGDRLHGFFRSLEGDRGVNLQELMAMLAAVLWALLWQPVGRTYGWWAEAAAIVAGGSAGLLAGWLFVEWLDRIRHYGRWGRTAVELTCVVASLVVFVGLPIWARSLVRAE